MAQEYAVDDVAFDAEDDDEMPVLEELEDEAEPDHTGVEGVRSGISTTASYRCFVSREVYVDYLKLFPASGLDLQKGESYADADMRHMPLLITLNSISTYDVGCQWRWMIESGSGVGRTDGEAIDNVVPRARSGALCKFHGAAHSQSCRFTYVSSEARPFFLGG
ncbi:hypothetical protein B0H11DRAFT_2235002 [Mycena galericulata]|nr:hypothetical protein B0H11DRAFT_2235002 [Mycena galericulata]